MKKDMKKYDGYNLVPTMNGAWVKHEDVETQLKEKDRQFSEQIEATHKIYEAHLKEANEIIKNMIENGCECDACLLAVEYLKNTTYE